MQNDKEQQSEKTHHSDKTHHSEKTRQSEKTHHSGKAQQAKKTPKNPEMGKLRMRQRKAFNTIFDQSTGNSGLQIMLQNRIRELEIILGEIEKAKNALPEGRLKIKNNHNTPQYYLSALPGSAGETYIRKSNIDLISSLSQKDYILKCETSVKQELAAIKSLITFQNQSIEQLYQNMPIEKKNYIVPFEIDDEFYKNLWWNQPFETNPYKPEELIHETDRKEMVRSKSEMVIANTYNALGIPYKYEAKLSLKNGYDKYPDFTVLDVKRRQIIYHEHLGRLDQESYRIDNLKKMAMYRDSGIYIGKNLIVTVEHDGIPININKMRKMFTEMFL